jgi:hypothetical protein
MKSHLSSIIPRMIRAGLRYNHCRYHIVAIGIDNRDRIISLATNLPRLKSRGLHAEERIIFNSPRSLNRILLLRVNKRGEKLPIDACDKCRKLANKRGVKIERI